MIYGYISKFWLEFWPISTINKIIRLDWWGIEHRSLKAAFCFIGFWPSDYAKTIMCPITVFIIFVYAFPGTINTLRVKFIPESSLINYYLLIPSLLTALLLHITRNICIISIIFHNTTNFIIIMFKLYQISHKFVIRLITNLLYVSSLIKKKKKLKRYN